MLYTSLLSALVPLFFFVVKIRQPKERAIWIVFFYIIYSFSTDSLTLFLSLTENLSESLDNTLSSLFTVIEFICFGLFFYFIIKQVKLRQVILWSLFVIGGLLASNIVFHFIEFENLDSIPVTVQGLFIMPLALVYYFEQIKKPDSLFIYGTPNFWIVTAILLYLAGTFFIFMLSENLTEKEFADYWSINYFFNTIKNLFFGLGIYMHNKKYSYENKENSLHYTT